MPFNRTTQKKRQNNSTRKAPSKPSAKAKAPARKPAKGRPKTTVIKKPIQPVQNPGNRPEPLQHFEDLEMDLRSGKLISLTGRPIVRSGPKAMIKQLSSEDYTRFLAYIMAGAMDHVAAACLGISSSTFYNWMRRGERVKRGIFARFYVDVLRAKNIARLRNEIIVSATDPLAWLKNAARSKEDLPGWTEAPAVVMEGPTINVQQNTSISSPENAIDQAAQVLEEMERMGYIQVTEAGKLSLTHNNGELTEADLFDKEELGE